MILTITIARKPVMGTVAQNVLKYGTGGLNIDGTRLFCGTEHMRMGVITYHAGLPGDTRTKAAAGRFAPGNTSFRNNHPGGRWPANLILSEDPGVLEMFPDSIGAAAPVKSGQSGKSNGIWGTYADRGDDGKSFHGDSGSASRFFKQIRKEE